MYKIAVMALIAFFIYTAIELVTVRYEQRQLYIQLDRTNKITQDLHTQWRFLELDRANLTSTLNFDKVLNDKLNLSVAPIGGIIYIQESELRPVQKTDNPKKVSKDGLEKNK